MTWHDHMGDNLADPLRNVERACDQMLTALDEGRYNFAEVHVRADLTYLRAEARRALRYRAQERAESEDAQNGPYAPISGPSAPGHVSPVIREGESA